MPRLSRLFWFTALAGGLSSLLLTGAVLGFFIAQTGEMTALSRQGKEGCVSAESLQHLYPSACLIQVAGTLLLFGLAHRIGRGLTRPATQALADAQQ